MVRDSISELVNGLKMASIAKKPNIVVRKTKLVKAVLLTLKKEGFIVAVEEKGKDLNLFLEATLNPEKKIVGGKRVSTFSKRVYKGSGEILSNSRMAGIYVLTTPKGVMSHRDARKEKVGGEVLFKIW